MPVFRRGNGVPPATVLAPVVEVNHAIRGHVKEQALMREVDKLRKENGR